MRRMLLRAVVVTALLILPAAPAGAEPYPPLAGEPATVSDTIIVAGGSFTLSGSGWLAGTTVTCTLFSDPVELGTAEVAADGTFSTELTIPEDTAPGTHTLQISGTSDENEPRVVELTVEVADPDAVGDVTETSNELAFTGANLFAGGALAAALLVGGGVALFVTRRRRDGLAVEAVDSVDS